jgi:hypothetical protein
LAALAPFATPCPATALENRKTPLSGRAQFLQTGWKIDHQINRANTAISVIGAISGTTIYGLFLNLLSGLGRIKAKVHYINVLTIF